MYLTGFVAVILAVFAYLFFSKKGEEKPKDERNGKNNDGLITLEARQDVKKEYPGSTIIEMEKEDSDSGSEVIDGPE